MEKREIKFRAWDKKMKAMFSPSRLCFGIPDDNSALGIGIPDSNINDSMEGYELMQYTGLKDKNGKEIYEGDIVRYDFLPEGDDQIGEVVYSGRNFCLKGGNNYMPEEVEILGNIYQNPELLS